MKYLILSIKYCNYKLLQKLNNNFRTPLKPTTGRPGWRRIHHPHHPLWIRIRHWRWTNIYLLLSRFQYVFLNHFQKHSTWNTNSTLIASYALTVFRKSRKVTVEIIFNECSASNKVDTQLHKHDVIVQTPPPLPPIRWTRW